MAYTFQSVYFNNMINSRLYHTHGLSLANYEQSTWITLEMYNSSHDENRSNERVSP